MVHGEDLTWLSTCLPKPWCRRRRYHSSRSMSKSCSFNEEVILRGDKMNMFILGFGLNMLCSSQDMIKDRAEQKATFSPLLGFSSSYTEGLCTRSSTLLGFIYP